MYFVSLLKIQIITLSLGQIFASLYNEEGWRRAGHYLSESLDYSKDPCNDFYGFVCGKWKEKFAGPNVYREYHKAAKEVVENLTAAMDTYQLNDPKLEGYKKSLKYFVEQCKTKLHNNNEALIEDIYKSLDQYFVPKIMVNVNGEEKFPWEVDDDDDKMIWRFAAVLMKEQNTPFLLDVSVDTREVNCSEQPILTVGIQYQNSEMFNLLDKQVLNILLGSVIGRHHNVSYDEQEINETLTDILALEQDIYNFWKRKRYGGSERYLLKDLSKAIPNVDWKTYFETLLPEEIHDEIMNNKDEEILIYSTHLVNQVKGLLKKYNTSTIYNYGYALVIQRYYDMFKTATTDKEVDITKDFGYQKVLQTNNPCLYLAFEYLPAASARLIFDVYSINPDEWRYGVNLIAETIFSAFRYLVYSLDWMDSEDKVLVNQKVSKMIFNHIIPDWLSNVELVNTKTPKYEFNLSLIANDIMTRRHMFAETFSSLVKGKIDQEPPRFDLNAMYDSMNIQIWLGMMLPPVYNNLYPLSVQYGGIGMVIGHELLHGFDAVRVKYESIEGFKIWLKSNTLKQYDMKAQCFIQQYSKYCFKESGACVKGDVSLNDNIADVEGLKVAYAAYKFQTHMSTVEPPLPGMENFTNDQLFFIANARQWCNALSGEQLKKVAFSDHSPDHTRVDLPVTNIRPFARAFKCPVGSRHAPIKTCSLWGSFWGV